MIQKLIYLTGTRPFYTVITSAFEGCPNIDVPNAAVGHAIVRGLRQHARQMLVSHELEDLFPPSMVAKAKKRQSVTAITLTRRQSNGD